MLALSYIASLVYSNLAGKDPTELSPKQAIAMVLQFKLKQPVEQIMSMATEEHNSIYQTEMPVFTQELDNLQEVKQLLQALTQKDLEDVSGKKRPPATVKPPPIHSLLLWTTAF